MKNDLGLLGSQRCGKTVKLSASKWREERAEGRNDGTADGRCRCDFIIEYQISIVLIGNEYHFKEEKGSKEQGSSHDHTNHGDLANTGTVPAPYSTLYSVVCTLVCMASITTGSRGRNDSRTD